MNQTVLTPQGLEPSSAITAKRRQWLDMVRAACYTVSRHSPALITATTVSVGCDGLSAVERHDLLSLATHVAAEENLHVELEDEGTHLVARFSRAAPARVNTPDADGVAAQALREEGT